MNERFLRVFCSNERDRRIPRIWMMFFEIVRHETKIGAILRLASLTKKP